MFGVKDFKEAAREIVGDSMDNYYFNLRYSSKFSSYGGNIRKTGNHLEIRLSRYWMKIDNDITKGFAQELLMKILRKKHKETSSVKLYNSFVKNIHKGIKKTIKVPELVEVFTRINDEYFYGIVEMPNLDWGSFSKTSLSQSVFLMIIVVVGILSSLLIIKPLNAILLGDKYAKSVGVNTKRLQTIVILISGFLIAITTAFTGPIDFIGLAVPHLARNFFQTSNHRVLLPAIIVMGGALTLLCNLIAKMPGYDTSLPINAVTSFIGAPIVIWVIIKRGRVKK